MSLPKYDRKKLHELVDEFCKNRDAKTRAMLIEGYSRLAVISAKKIAARRRIYDLDLEDMTNVGIIGLINAIDKYEPIPGATFETYCVTKIKGAIKDELRRFETNQRMRRAQTQTSNKHLRKLEKKLGRPLNPEDLEAYDFIKQRRKVSLDKYFGPENDNNMASLLEEKRHGDPIQEISTQETKEVILEQCTMREASIIMLYYYKRLNLKQIGAILDLNESRICQIHRNLIKKLQACLGDRKEEFFTNYN